MAATTAVAVKPRGTSWMSVLGGWIASVGMAAILAPLAAGYVATRGGTPNDLSLAVPAILAVMTAYLVGGYVAGRMAGYSTSWHGLMTAFLGLFVILAIILIGVAIDRGYLGAVRTPFDGSYVLGFGPATIGDALTFGAILSFLAAIFAGWLGGLLAPDRLAVARVATPIAPATRTVEETTVVREPAPRRERLRLFPSAGRKGGERAHDHRDDPPAH